AVEGVRAQWPFEVHPAGGWMQVIEVRGGAEKAFLADLAFKGAGRQIGVRLPRCLALDLGKLHIALHTPNLVSSETNWKGRTSGFLQDSRDTHATRGAHRDQAAFRRGGFRQLLGELRDDARAGGRERVANGHARAVHVELRAVDAAQRPVEAEVVP